MNVNCNHCGEDVDVGDARPGDWVECPRCEAEVQVPSTAVKRKRRREFDEMNPVMVPVMIPSSEDAELTEERKKDLQDIRRYRNEDRAGNPIGIGGFAIAVTTFLFLFGAVVLHRFMPLYLWFVAVLSVPTALLGLVLSIVGSLLVGRPKLLSFIGVGISGFLVLVGLPVSFLLLKSL